MKLFRKIKDRNHRKEVRKRRKGQPSFLERLFGIKKVYKPTFWQLRERKCKTCEKCNITFGRVPCSEDKDRYGYTKPTYICCGEYEPKKSRAL